MMNVLVLASALIGSASAHMAVSNPVPLDAKIGDAYRHPVSSDNRPTDGGTCHGQTAGATYAWVWTPKASGTCEIYQSCFDTLPASGTLKMSFGAAHQGGPCKLYSCPGGVTTPTCDRSATGVSELPETYDACTAIASTPDCTILGSMTWASGGGGGTQVDVPPSLPPNQDDEVVGNPSATASKIRCGTTWTNANSKCGDICTTNNDCTVTGEACFADLADCPTSGSSNVLFCGSTWSDAGKCSVACPGGTNAECPSGESCWNDVDTCTPVTPPTRPTPSTMPAGCVSSVGHISDDWCQTAKCAQVYVDGGYCKISGPSATSALLETTTCILYAAFEGETWGDVAIKYDVSLEAIKAANSAISGSALEADTVLEIPGDCTSARKQVGSINAGSSLEPSTALVASTLACALLAAYLTA